MTFNTTLEQLFIISAGNITVDAQLAGLEYPYVQINDSVHDPTQSWNAISVVSLTQKIGITDPNLSSFEPVAMNEQLSPFSTTSTDWEENNL